MLHFLIFLGFLVIFCSPLIASAISQWRGNDVSKKRWWFNGAWAVGGMAIILIAKILLSIWTSVLWFQETGYTDRFWTIFWAKIWYFCLGTVITAIFFWINSRLSRIGLKKESRGTNSITMAYRVIAVFSLTFSVFFGLGISGSWEKILLFQNQVSFGVNDPIFQNDVGFYVFTIPFLEFVRTFSILAIIIGMLVAGGSYIFQYYDARDNYSYDRGEYDKQMNSILFRGLTHLSALFVLLLGAFAFSTRLATWDLLYSTRGAVFGAGYTDVHIQIGAYLFLIAAFIVSAILLFAAALSRSVGRTASFGGIGLGLCFFTWLIGAVIVPAYIQRFNIEPNELKMETEYIQHNIQFTKQAYGLIGDKVKESEFPVNPAITAETVVKDKATLDGIRLWDWRVLQQTNNQRQLFRNYYAFPDVDLVRYNIGDKLCQLMYSSREMSQNLPSQTWQNKRMIYTHGYGGCANPVSTFTEEGLPDYWLKDTPPMAKYPELKIDEPRIYFGETTREQVYVNTNQAEFDHPKGDQNVTCYYNGPGGIELNSWLRKFAFALRFDGLRLLTSKEVDPDSRIMFNRDIFSRVGNLVPFLKLDNDPYQVVADGKLWFIWDAYTTTTRYPYSEPHRGFAKEKSSEKSSDGVNQLSKLNYVRNSVKITVNAFTGETNFYVFDEQDPLVRAYQNIFPGFFKTASQMPKSLLAHIRYPEDLLSVQGDILCVYHMSDPTVFYNKEDAWSIAEESTGNEVREVIPYYVIMRIPGETTEEFVQMLPFTPRSLGDTKRSNMVAWLAGRCDGNHYGELVLYKFPKDYLVIGPLQMAARINQNTTISEKFTLWNQQGSQVYTGNLLVIPLSGSQLLYVQPVYLKSTVSPMPELKKVIVASGEKVAFEDSFDKALFALMEITAESSAEETGVETAAVSTQLGSEPARSSTDKKALAKEAAQHLENYQKLTGQGKLAEAGREMQKLGDTLNLLLK